MVGDAVFIQLRLWIVHRWHECVLLDSPRGTVFCRFRSDLRTPPFLKQAAGVSSKRGLLYVSFVMMVKSQAVDS